MSKQKKRNLLEKIKETKASNTTPCQQYIPISRFYLKNDSKEILLTKLLLPPSINNY